MAIESPLNNIAGRESIFHLSLLPFQYLCKKKLCKGIFTEQAEAPVSNADMVSVSLLLVGQELLLHDFLVAE